MLRASTRNGGARRGFGNVAVVARIVYGGRHEAVDEPRAGSFIEFVFDRLATRGNFNDDVEIIGQIPAGGYAV